MLVNPALRNKVSMDLKESFRRENGWIPCLEKYVNIQTNQVSDTIPIDIQQFQEDIVRRFSTFTISSDDIFSYFVSVKQGMIATRDGEVARRILVDLVRELSRPAYYRECVDCIFFQQKTERMKKVIENEFDSNIFKQYLELLSEKRKNYTELTSSYKSEEVAVLIATATNFRQKTEATSNKTAALDKFMADIKNCVILQEDEMDTLNPLRRNNKIIISNDKNKISLLNEIIQRLSTFDQYKIQEVPPIHINKIMHFLFEFQGQDLSIPGEPKTSKQKAKESCCEIVMNKIIHSLKQKLPLSDNSSTETQPQPKERDLLLFSANELQVAKLRDDIPAEDEENNSDLILFADHPPQKTKEARSKKMIAEQEKENLNINEVPKKIVSSEGKKNEIVNTKEDENEYDLIIKSLNVIREELGLASKMELNPFIILKKIIPDPKKNLAKLKKFNALISSIIQHAVRLYDYEEYKQSPCVLVQENGQTLFLKTIIMKKSGKSKPLVGRVRAMNEEQAFFCSALELIYKFAYRHQEHHGNITSLDQVISELIYQADYKSQDFNQEKTQALNQKNTFMEKTQKQPDILQSCQKTVKNLNELEYSAAIKQKDDIFVINL